MKMGTVLQLCFAAAAVMFMMITASSCKIRKQYITVHDTVKITEKVIIRDTVLIAPAAKATLKIPLKSLMSNDQKNPFKTSVKNKQAGLNASVDNDTLNVECGCDTVALIAKLRDKYIEKERNRTKTITPEPEKIPFIPWYVGLLASIGGVALIALLIALIIKRFFS